MTNTTPTLDPGDGCEWSPYPDSSQQDKDYHRMTVRAVVLVGAAAPWRLCAQCAQLPKFKLLRKRVSLVKSSRRAVKSFTFHGEIREDIEGHRHYEPKPSDLEGKTIQKFVCDADNVWSLFFTDGTAVAIETEVHGQFGIPAMDLCNTCWKDPTP